MAGSEHRRSGTYTNVRKSASEWDLECTTARMMALLVEGERESVLVFVLLAARPRVVTFCDPYDRPLTALGSSFGNT